MHRDTNAGRLTQVRPHHLLCYHELDHLAVIFRADNDPAMIFRADNDPAVIFRANNHPAVMFRADNDPARHVNSLVSLQAFPFSAWGTSSNYVLGVLRYFLTPPPSCPVSLGELALDPSPHHIEM